MVDFNMFESMRKKYTINSALFFSIPTFVIIFVFSLGAGFLAALLFGLVLGSMLFGTVVGISFLNFKGIERKRKKTEFIGPYIDVMFRSENGALEILDDRFIYHALTVGSDEKSFEIMIDENLFIGAGEISFTKLQEFRYRGVKQGHITLKEMPHGIVRQFIFFDVDNSLEKVYSRIDEVNRFVEE